MPQGLVYWSFIAPFLPPPLSRIATFCHRQKISTQLLKELAASSDLDSRRRSPTHQFHTSCDESFWNPQLIRRDPFSISHNHYMTLFVNNSRNIRPRDKHKVDESAISTFVRWDHYTVFVATLRSVLPILSLPLPQAFLETLDTQTMDPFLSLISRKTS